MITWRVDWVFPGRLGGSALPGLFNPIEEDVARMRELGIRLVVTLTEAPLDPPMESFGLRSLHFPIPDMNVPTPRATELLCDTIGCSLNDGEPVLLHCRAGLGRTGTMLACYLVKLGREPEEAIREVRRTNPSFIQSTIQERFIEHFRDHLAGLDTSDSSMIELPRLKLPDSVLNRPPDGLKPER